METKENVTKKPEKTGGVLNYLEYKKFRDMSKEEIQELDLIHVTLEKRVSAQYGESVVVTAHLADKWSVIYSGKQAMTVNQYNVLVYDHPHVSEDKNRHELHVPARFLERKDEKGETKYKRLELMFTRDVVISKFFDGTDTLLCSKVRPEQKFFADKDITEAFEAAKKEIYSIYE